MVREWSTKINIVSPNDLTSLWQRHIVDSAQLPSLAESPGNWVDLGSGGGFPGLVVAIILQQNVPGVRVTLVESDKRKCAFLSAVARKLDLAVQICPQRIERLDVTGFTTLSARALAPLERLLGYAHPLLSTDGVALFPKGRNWRKELAAAEDKWSFDMDMVKSATESDAAILKVGNIKRIH